MPTQTLVIFVLGAAGAGGLLWAVIYPMLADDREAERRNSLLSPGEPLQRGIVRGNARPRREQIETTLRELETRRKKTNRPPLSVRLAQAGLTWSKRKFMIISAVLGLVALGLGLLFGVGILPALGIGFAAGLGLPRWMLAFLKKRREKRFLNIFPDAVDVVVRGIRAGLPLVDCLKIIANETAEPVRGEFKAIIDAQSVGLPIGEACAKLHDSIPVPEANFFGIVVSIQQKAGGNLSEALGNLSKVLRERKRMAAKIQAMSMEAKASASIIGALPGLVMVMVYFTNPDYIQLLWSTPVGRVMLAACATWMAIGTFVMKRMINFDF